MKFSIEEIDHVQVAAPKNSEDEAVSFYSGVLGMKQIEKPAALQSKGGVWFRFGRVQLHIGIEEPFHPAKKAHPAFKVNGFELLKQHLEEKEIEVMTDRSIPGVERFFIFDPFGNRLEFMN